MTRAAADAELGALVMSLSEVAELADVQRPVVTTWRRRYPDFPEPLTTLRGQPLFDGHAVCRWLVETGRARREELEPDLRLYALANVDNSLGSRTLIEVLTALVCLQHLDGEPVGAAADELVERAADADPRDLMLRSEITTQSARLPLLGEVADELIEAAWGTRGAVERIMGLRGRLGLSDLRDNAMHPQLARLVAELSGAARHAERAGSVSIVDPAAAQGDLLLATVATVGEAFTPVVTAGEPDAFFARLLRRRLLVHGVPAEDVTVTGSLDDSVEPDVLVTALPFEPGESRSPLDVLTAVDDLAVRLAPGRTAVVLGPAQALTSALRPFSPEERLRAQLLTGGMVEAVIRLPGGMYPARPGYETALWVLTATRDERSRGWVLLGDISDRELTPEVVEACVTDVVTWRRDGHRPAAHTRTFCVQTQVSDLVDPPRALTPRALPSVREHNTVVPETVARVTELEAALSEYADPEETPREPVLSGLGVAESAAGPRDTIAGLVKRGWLRIVQGSRIADADIASSGHHRIIGRAEVCDGDRAGDRWIDRAVLARYPRAGLTEAGDVLVTLVPEPFVQLDERGFSVVEFPVRTVRIAEDGSEYFTPLVLAALLEASAHARSPGAVRPPRKLTEWELPVLEPRTVWRLDRLLASLAQRHKQARAELDAVAELRQIAVTGIATATLTFPQ